MLFNSYVFIFVFFPLTLGGYFLLNKFTNYKLSKIYLIVMSLWFYAYFNYSYLLIILISIVCNYYFSFFMHKIVHKKTRIFLLVSSIFFNVGILFYFKYMNFFIYNLNRFFSTSLIIEQIILPLGISFFTFQQLSYVIDSYSKDIPIYSFVNYSLFVTFFPQLIAGPIVLHSEIIPQFEDESNKTFNWNNFSIGLMAFSSGIAKKILVADAFGRIVDWGFNLQAIGGSLGSTNAILVMLAYTFQLYFDFSGYCDMATGIAKCFNIDLPINFNSPYKALTINEFWKRWHITLTRFLRVYIYIPLGGNRKGIYKTYMNLFIVFLISGIWHGANYTFIIWGMLHGIAILINKVFKDKIECIHPVLNWLITFSFINLTWIIFRSDSISQAIAIFKQIFSFKFTEISSEIFNALYTSDLSFIISKMPYINERISIFFVPLCFLLALIAVLGLKNTNEKIEKFSPSLHNAIFYSVILFVCITSIAGISTFLYFNF